MKVKVSMLTASNVLLACWLVVAPAAAERTATSTPTPAAVATSTPTPAAEGAPAPSSGGLAPTLKLKVGGYVEVFYQLSFNAPSNFITAYRGFDNRSSSFTIDNAVLDVTAELGPAFARVALQVGHAPFSYYGAEPSSPATAGVGPSAPELWHLIQQAIVGYKIPVGRGLLAEAGIFISPIGIEQLAIKDNWNWSRSNLFFGLPFYHAGVRLTYPLTDQLTAAVYATNGWNDIITRNGHPAVAGLLTWTPSEQLSGTLLYFGGVEAPRGAPEGQPWRNLFDLNATWSPSPYLSLAMQADAGIEANNFGTSWWASGAAYARVHPAEWLFIAARGDYFHEGVAPGAARLFFPADEVISATATIDLRPVENLSFRTELRLDWASADLYFRGAVAADDAGGQRPNTRRQQTLTFGALAWF